MPSSSSRWAGVGSWAWWHSRDACRPREKAQRIGPLSEEGNDRGPGSRRICARHSLAGRPHSRCPSWKARSLCSTSPTRAPPARCPSSSTSSTRALQGRRLLRHRHRYTEVVRLVPKEVAPKRMRTCTEEAQVVPKETRTRRAQHHLQTQRQGRCHASPPNRRTPRPATWRPPAAAMPTRPAAPERLLQYRGILKTQCRHSGEALTEPLDSMEATSVHVQQEHLSAAIAVAVGIAVAVARTHGARILAMAVATSPCRWHSPEPEGPLQCGSGKIHAWQRRCYLITTTGIHRFTEQCLRTQITRRCRSRSKKMQRNMPEGMTM
mmetsp:Transcript_7538/g.20067  ORF Transcript_7538/g.20067 Transcript_7538/m.20067 type:complete len:322 (+) Transcript_7538:650-1615(+)